MKGLWIGGLAVFLTLMGALLPQVSFGASGEDGQAPALQAGLGQPSVATYMNWMTSIKGGEPSLGIAPTLGGGTASDGTAAFGTTTLLTAGTAGRVVRLRFDDSKNPPTVEETNVAPAPVGNQDPFLYTDAMTGRTWATGLEAIGTYPAGVDADSAIGLGASTYVIQSCVYTRFTDDNGETWSPPAVACPVFGNDHQGLAAGPLPGTQAQSGAPYPPVVYVCVQNGFACSESRDGGLTYVPQEGQPRCGGGKMRVSPDGIAYLPGKACGARTGFAVLDAEGWHVRTAAPTSVVQSTKFDPAVDVSLDKRPGASDHRVYLVRSEREGTYVAASDDRGLHWVEMGRGDGAPAGRTYYDLMQAWNQQHPDLPPLRQTEFAQVAVGDWDRAAVSFLATTTPPSDHYKDDVCRPKASIAWHIYVARTFDGGISWNVERASDNVVQRDSIRSSHKGDCHYMLDFTDMRMDAAGRYLVAYTDGCLNICDLQPEAAGPRDVNYHQNQASILRLTGGCGLLGGKDVFADQCAPRPWIEVHGIAAPDRPLLAKGGAIGGAEPYSCEWLSSATSVTNLPGCEALIEWSSSGAQSLVLVVRDATGLRAAAQHELLVR